VKHPQLKLTRRSLFRAAGGVAFATPWLESIAQTAAPKRFISLYHPNGVHRPQWDPTVSGSTFMFGASQTELAPFKSDLMYLQGIDMKTALSGAGEQHQRGLAGLLTGRKIEAGSFTGNDGTTAGWASGISIDQELVKVLGEGARVASLQLGVNAGERDVSGCLSYAGPATPLLPQNDPRQTFARLFDVNPAPNDVGEPLRRRRASVLDAVREQFALLKSRVSTADRVQLDTHLDRVRQLELRLTALPLPVQCQTAMQPPEVLWATEKAMPEVAKLQLDLMVLAMACDLTRVATVMFSDAKNHIALPFINVFGDVHNISHMSNQDVGREDLAKRDRWQAEQLAYLLGKLKESKIEGGGNLLENTLVFWGSEVAEGNLHSHNDMPFLVAGGGAKWKMGRVLKFDVARPHNDLLLSILQGLGGTHASFGDPAFVTGPLTGLT
jgi:hypothetical protein